MYWVTIGTMCWIFQAAGGAETAAAFHTGTNLLEAFFINVFITAVFSGIAYWWMSRFERKQLERNRSERQEEPVTQA